MIALSRLDVKEWPIVLRDQKLAEERKAYEAAYAKVRQECVNKDLSIPSVQSVSSAIKSLKGKASCVIPAESGYRKSAVEFVNRLDEATKMFEADTLDYAAEIVKDTREHDATTVGELLAFMRKYRLIFGSFARACPAAGTLTVSSTAPCGSRRRRWVSRMAPRPKKRCFSLGKA